MGQIWNRISRLANSYFNENSVSSSERIITSDDDDLRAIIEDLNNPQHKQRPEPAYNQSKQQNPKDSDGQHYSKRRTSGAMTSVKASAILGVELHASISEIKSAYKKKVMIYHPDRLSNATLTDQAQAKKIIVEINQAYQFFQQTKGF